MPKPPPPWHLRPAAALAVLWHLIGAADYLLTRLGATAYLAWFAPDQIAYFTQMPLWADIAWACGVWLGLLGGLLLWARHRRAPLAFAIGFAGLAVLTLGLVFLRSPPLAEVTGMAGVWTLAGATVAALLFHLYARSLHARGLI